MLCWVDVFFNRQSIYLWVQNCALLLADLFLYSYEADFIQGFKKNENKLARSLNFTFRCIDDVISLNNCRFCDFIDRIYPIELEIKDTTYTDRYVSYLDLHLEIDSEGQLRTKIYDKIDDLNFPVVNLTFICINIHIEPMVPFDEVEVITSKIARSPSWLGWPLWNFRVTNDHGYVPHVLNTSRYFPHSRLITGFITRLTRRMLLVEQELLPLPEHLSSSSVFSGVRVTQHLVLYVFFIDRCLTFCTFPFGYCVVCSSAIYGFWLPLWYLQTLLIVLHLTKEPFWTF